MFDPTDVINSLKGQSVETSIIFRGKKSTKTLTTSVTVVQVHDEPLSLAQLIWNRHKHHE
jgi:hypothetical protein